MIAHLLLMVGLLDVRTFTTTIAPAFETKAYKAPAPAAPVPGLHSHRCSRCGNVWSHGSDSFGKVAEHTCPKCGTVNWNPINNQWQQTLPMYRPMPNGQAFRNNCPTGH